MAEVADLNADAVREYALEVHGARERWPTVREVASRFGEVQWRVIELVEQTDGLDLLVGIGTAAGWAKLGRGSWEIEVIR